MPRGPALLNGTAVDISCGYDFCGALLADGTVQTWGVNNGLFAGLALSGNAFVYTGDNEAPFTIGRTFPASAGVTRVVCGYQNCAAMAPGCLKMWGYDGNLLGYGLGWDGVGDDERVQDVPCLGGCISTTPVAALPLPVGGSTVTEIVAGMSHTCAITNGNVT